MPSISGNKIIFDQNDWLATMHSRYNSGAVDTPLLAGGKLSYALGFHPYRAFGIASPGFLPTPVTNASVVSNSAMQKIIMAAETSTYYAYGIDSGASLFQIATTGTITSGGAWPHTISSASGTEEGSSLIAYSAKIGGTRAQRVFYSYSASLATATDPQWNVGVYSLDGSTFDDDFMTTAPATPLVSTVAGGGVAYRPHPMIVGDDDILYIGDGNKVHGYDGASSADNDGKFIDSVLTLPAGFMITSFAKYQKNLCIVGYFDLRTPVANSSVAIDSYYRTEARAYFWDYLSLDPWDSKSLNDNYANGAFEYRGTIGCFSQGRIMVPTTPQVSKMLIFDGSEFVPVATFDTNIPTEGGVEVLGDTISFVSQGNIYMYGSPYPKDAPTGLNRVGKGNGIGTGGICTLSSSIQVVSTGTTTSGGLDTVNTGYCAALLCTGSVSPVFDEGKMGVVKSVKVYYASTNSAINSRYFDLYLVSNKNAQTQIISQAAAITASTQVATIYETIAGASLPTFTNLAIAMQWQQGVGGTNAPRVERVEVTFESIGINETGP